MNSQAQRARDIARQRTRNKLIAWQTLTIVSTVSMLIAWTAFYLLASSTWRSDQAPPLQRVHVVTEGFMDRQGQWRSFDTGERITAKYWKP